MLFAEPNHKIWLYTEAVDMRKSYNGLVGVVKQKLLENPLSGQYFVFINKRKTQMKVLYFESGGYCIWSKRLEQGQFNPTRFNSNKTVLSSCDLKLIIDGVKVKKVRQYKRFSLPKT
jgi:transposase